MFNDTDLMAELNTTDMDQSVNVQTDREDLLNSAKYKAYIRCSETVLSQPFPEDDVLYCYRLFDGWGCWEDTPAGETAFIPCPTDVVDLFDPNLLASKYCTENGTWWKHPDSGLPWSNYTGCINHTELQKSTRTLYIHVIGYSLSIITLLVSLFIFFYFRQLQCERITLHRNLFFSYTCCALTWIIYYLAVSTDVHVLLANPVWCRGIHLLTQYFTASNFLWMFCEGFFLHTKLVFAFASGEKLLFICRIVGWVLPIFTTLIYGCVRGTSGPQHQRQSCWSVKSSFQWIVFVPIILSILLNIIFLCNIVRLLVTKLRALNSTDATQTKQATRATLILIPLLGIQFVFFPIQPSEGTPGRTVYMIFSALFISLQGFFVAVIYCFFNGEVLSVLRRKWHQRQLMKGRRDTSTMWTISYTHGEERQSIATTTSDLRRSSSSFERRSENSYKYNGVKKNPETKKMLDESDAQ